MIRNALIILLFLFFLFIAAAVAAFYYWGWAGLLAVVAAIFLVVWLIQRFFLRFFLWLMTRPLRQQAAHLRGATIEVHEVARTQPPDDRDGAEFDFGGQFGDPTRAILGQAVDAEGDDDELETPYYSGPRDYYTIDLTITPVADKGNERIWNPAAITVIPLKDQRDVVSSEAKFLGFGFDGSCELYDFSFWRGGSFQPFDEDADTECSGSRRVRLHVGVKPDVDELKLLYYFESIGSVQLRTTIDV